LRLTFFPYRKICYKFAWELFFDKEITYQK
jgi:hypothetical protein